MKTLSLLLCAAMAALPLSVSADDPPEPITLFEAVLAGTVVIVAGVAIYVVYRTAQATQDKCGGCGQVIPPKQFSCPSCGKAYRCEECGTKLPATGTQCPKCSTPIPRPKPPLKSVQSNTGNGWAPVASVAPGQVFCDDLSIMAFASPAAFDAWRAGQTNIVNVQELGLNPQALFRLSSE